MPRKINVYSLGKVYCKRFYAKTPPSYPLQLPPYTGGDLITKRFPLLCKEGLGVVVIKRLTCLAHPQPPG